MSSLSYREKTLYASLLAELAVYGPYFLLPHENTINRIAATITAIIVLQIILQAIIAVATRNRTVDERDRLIELKGYRAAYLSFVSLMVLGFAMLWYHATAGHMRLDSRMMGLHFLNVFFAILVISDFAKTTFQLVAYRKAL